MSTNHVNWAGNATYSAEAILEPATVDELQGMVARWPRVRALGTRHSFTDIADTSGALISLARIDPDIRIDPAAMTASVTGGTPYGVLIRELQAHGLRPAEHRVAAAHLGGRRHRYGHAWVR